MTLDLFGRVSVARPNKTEIKNCFAFHDGLLIFKYGKTFYIFDNIDCDDFWRADAAWANDEKENAFDASNAKNRSRLDCSHNA